MHMNVCFKYFSLSVLFKHNSWNKNIIKTLQLRSYCWCCHLWTETNIHGFSDYAVRLWYKICLISFLKVPLFFSPFTTCKLTETASNLSGWHWYWPLWLESTWVKMAEDSKVNNSFLFEKSLELLESGTICQSSDNGVPSRYLKKKS